MTNDKQTTSESPSCGAACSPSLIPSDERHPCRTWAANEHEDTLLVLADYADHVAAERAEAREQRDMLADALIALMADPQSHSAYYNARKTLATMKEETK
jgi:predicted kinase